MNEIINVILGIYMVMLIPEAPAYSGMAVDACDIEEAPAVDAVEVVRCKNCRYYHKEHVRCNDGTEKDISEFPPEAFGVFGYVTGEYGINVGGQCEIDKNCGYAVDKSVYRQPEDFCSRGVRRCE